MVDVAPIAIPFTMVCRCSGIPGNQLSCEPRRGMLMHFDQAPDEIHRVLAAEPFAWKGCTLYDVRTATFDGKHRCMFTGILEDYRR